MKNKRVIILIVLGIGAAVSLIYGISVPTKGKPKAVSPSEQKAVAPDRKKLLSAKRIIPTKRRTAKTEHESWSRNPFVPKGAGEASPELSLGGIMWSETDPKAMVNSDIVRAGDKVGGYTVVEIKKDKVTLNDGSEDITLRLE